MILANRNLGSGSLTVLAALTFGDSGCGARTGLRQPEESAFDSGIRLDSSQQPMDASTDAINRDGMPNDGDGGFVSICDSYDPFTPLAPIRPDTPLNVITLGGRSGRFVCYQEWNNVEARDPLPSGWSTPYTDGYAVLDRDTGAITRLNVIHNEGLDSKNCSLSSDGRFTAVIESPQAAGPEQILLFDSLNPTMPRHITAGNAPSVSARLTPDAHYVYYISRATNLTPESNENGGLFVYDVRAQTTRRLPLPSNIYFPLTPPLGILKFELNVSSNGNRLVFMATNSSDPESLINPQIYYYDIERQQAFHISSSPSGDPANSQCFSPYISGDGRRILFSSTANNLLPEIAGLRSYHVFLWEEGLGLRLLSTTPEGRPLTQNIARSGAEGISDDGTRAFITITDPQVEPRMWPDLPIGDATELIAVNIDTGARSLVYQNLCLGIRFGTGAISADGSYGVGSFMGIEPGTTHFYAYPLLGFPVRRFLP